jgi:hypothetical protein
MTVEALIRNNVVLDDTVCSIPLTKGMFALVSKNKYERINANKWYAKRVKNNWYAARNVVTPTGRKTVFMHVEILGEREGYETDHWNHNGLDNRDENLRFSTKGQNQQNRRTREKGSRYSSRYKGVVCRKRVSGEVWEARISIEGKPSFLGHFETEIEAARAYDRAALKRFGEFANINLDYPEENGKN